MSIKRKLILMGICIGIIIVVFTVNVVRRMKEDNSLSKDIVAENTMTYAEAYRLLSYLDYDKIKREAIPMDITYSDQQMSGWYDTYVNAVRKMGLINENITVSPTKALTFGACKQLIDNLIIKKPELQTVYEGLSFDFLKADDVMLIPEFLELYHAILSAVPEEDKNWEQKTLLVLGREVTEDGKDRMVTDQGKYYYLAAKSYEKFLRQEPVQADAALEPEKAADSKASDMTSAKNSADRDNKTEKGVKKDSAEEGSLVEKYLDKGIMALVCGQEILYVTSETSEKIVVHNVWIKQGEGLKVDTFINGLDKSFPTVFKLSSSINKVIGDITVENQKIVQISVKPDEIKGKVLRTGEDFIEIDGYGKIPLEEDFKIYKVYGTLSMEPTKSILVGYKNTHFIVSGGKISAALITESIKAENIRVLLKTTGYQGIYHDKVEFTAKEDFTVSYGKDKTTYHAGDKVLIKPGDEIMSKGRAVVKADDDKAKIEILSIERSGSHPRYRGSIEITEDENGLLVVNELPLEEYLYAVIPSEMPTGYGLEALKVQAVCARSYAYKHLLTNSLSQYGAHVDDSAAYQVYNNIAENEDSILAVKDTYGQVMEYEGEVINAYYFSTSCGHTAKASEVWSTNVDLPYLEGKLLLTEEEGEGSEAYDEAASLFEDLSSEESFQKFIEAKDVTTYDSSFNWYRWKVTMTGKDLGSVIDNCLASRYAANPELILTKTGEAEAGKEAVYESIPVDTVGIVEDITILKRESSGIVTEVLITGSKNTIKVRTEYNIRALFAPSDNVVIRQDKSKVDGLSMLPSAFFTMDKNESNNKLSSITLLGGGYGHGVGLSQNGVKGLVDSGRKYKDVLAYFYEGTEVGFIYE